MIRKIFKKTPSDKLHRLLKKYDIKANYFTINRRSVSKGVMIGIFFALLPVPSQIILVLLVSLLVQFNLVIALSIVLLTNPLTMPFIIYAEYQLGSFLTHSHTDLEMQLSMQWIEQNHSLIILPLLYGSLSAATLLSTSSYFIVRALWIESAKKAYISRKRDA